MQTVKTMFRSPRFVVGFIMVLIVVLYALLVPVFIQTDPKESRAENPFYAQAMETVDLLRAGDMEAAQAAMEALKEAAQSNEDAVLSDAAKNALETVSVIDEALQQNPYAGSISSLDKVKGRKFPLVRDEREAMRLALEAGDEAAAKAEGEALVNHCVEAEAFIASITAAGSDVAAAQSAVEAFAGATDTELADIKAAIEAADGEALEKAVADFTTQHQKLYEVALEAVERMSVSLYDTAADAAATKVQKTYLIPKNTPPNARFWFGTDNFSRDLFLEMAYGAQTSLMVGLIAGTLATIIGIVLGLTAGYVGGTVDSVLTTITNIFTVIPSTIILILISIALGQVREAWLTGVIIGLIAWPWTARSVRAQTTSLRYRDHVNMARITGYSTAHIITTEIMPYLMSYIVMAFILQVAGGIGQEATLAILGLGDPTGISLGRLMNWAMEYEAINFNRWWLFIPVSCSIAMITYGLYLMNSGMDQVFNPKIRS